MPMHRPSSFNQYTPYPLDAPSPVVPTFNSATAPAAAPATGPATRSTLASAAPASTTSTTQPSST
eukprot:5818735-Pleurochrysis_carterae.AAC.1